MEVTSTSSSLVYKSSPPSPRRSLTHSPTRVFTVVKIDLLILRSPRHRDTCFQQRPLDSLLGIDGDGNVAIDGN